MSLDLLPISIKVRVLSFLTQNELKTKAAKINFQWNQLCNVPLLQREIVIDGRSPQKNVLKLEKYRRLRTVKFINVHTWSWLWRVSNFSYLRCVEFDNCKIDNVDELFFLSTHFQSIRVLKCRNTAQDITPILLLAPECANIEELDIAGSCIETVDEKLFSSLTDIHGHNLKKMAITCKGWSKDGYMALNKCIKLANLRIISADEHIKELEVPPRLRVLDIIYGINIPDWALIIFFENFTVFNLRSVTLELCVNLTNTCLKSIADNCPCLKELRICDSPKIYDGGIRHFSKCRNLERMTLRNCLGIRSIIWPSILLSKKFKYLDLQECIHVTKTEIYNRMKYKNGNFTFVHPGKSSSL